ncbi:hypothetical protein VTO42DRAFT_5783 [Malbranchea cinnamomea]
MASLPRNISGSSSQLFFQDKQSPQYKALLEISQLPHSDRAILASFIEDAAGPQEAARYFLHAISPPADSSESTTDAILRFLSAWKTLIEKLRPTLAENLSDEVKDIIYRRDGDCCCVTKIPFKSPSDMDLNFVHIIPPTVSADPELSEGTTLSDMLEAFLSRIY